MVRAFDALVPGSAALGCSPFMQHDSLQADQQQTAAWRMETTFLDNKSKSDVCLNRAAKESPGPAAVAAATAAAISGKSLWRSNETAESQRILLLYSCMVFKEPCCQKSLRPVIEAQAAQLQNLRKAHNTTALLVLYLALVS
jgi:hypothetical protein